MSKRLLATIIVTMALLSCSTCLAAEQIEARPAFRASAGYGLPYGGFGVNFETALGGYVGVAAGIGATEVGTGYAVGVRLYPLGKAHLVSPRIGVYRGVTAVEEIAGGREDIRRAYAAGVGLDWETNWAGNGLKDTIDFEVLLAEEDALEGYRLKGGRLKFSIGYGFRF